MPFPGVVAAVPVVVTPDIEVVDAAVRVEFEKDDIAEVFDSFTTYEPATGGMSRDFITPSFDIVELFPRNRSKKDEDDCPLVLDEFIYSFLCLFVVVSIDSNAPFYQ